MAGYRRVWKSIVYQISVERSGGSKLWDIDGNEYIDIAMGFGLNLFGHSPEFVTTALHEQLERGVEVGPQSPLAGEVAELLCDFSRKDRVTFCNTGSEAVMAAMRLARTVTGKSKIVYFNKDYHGNFEEVLLRSNQAGNQRHAARCSWRTAILR
ncbi:MAG: aminotransferase class III-fold pyridoxal phosphate-dependent enzyme [Pirellulaceae bacterium]